MYGDAYMENVYVCDMCVFGIMFICNCMYVCICYVDITVKLAASDDTDILERKYFLTTIF